MKLTITEAPVLPSVIPESYSIEIEVMGGDGDYYKSFTVDGFERDRDEELLESLLSLLPLLKSTYPHGRGGGEEDSYSQVPGFESWFSSSNMDYADSEWRYEFRSDAEKSSLALGHRVEAFSRRVIERAKLLGLESFSPLYWPRDATMGDFDCHGEVSYIRHQLYYYDQSCLKHSVEVEL